MPYSITLTNGTLLTTVADTTVDNTSSLTLVGRNFAGYGGYIAEDMVHLLENFAYSTPPANPLVGQLWYNTSTSVLEIWNGAAWNTSDIRGTGITEVATDAALPAPSLAATSVYYVDSVGGSLPALASRLGSNWYYYPAYFPTYVVDIGSVNTVVGFITPSPVTLAHIGGIQLGILVANANTGAVTININSFGAIALINPNGTAITPGQLYANSIIEVVYDGTHFQLISVSPGVTPTVSLPSLINLYVTTTGNDTTGNGTSGAPFASITRAWAYLCNNYNLNSFGAQINVGNGVYTQPQSISSQPVGSGGIAIVGNPSTPLDVLIQVAGPVVANAFSMESSANVTLNGLSLVYNGTATNGSGNLISAQSGGILTIENIVFNTFPNNAQGILAATGSQIIINSGCSIASNITGGTFMRAFSNGNVYMSAVTMAVGSNITFNIFADADTNGTLSATSGAGFSGGSGMTATRYSATFNGVIYVSGAGAGFFPGSVSGGTASGGQYG